MTHPYRITLLAALAFLGLSLGTLPTPPAHAVVGAACPTGQNAECGDPLQVCRNNTCVSLENEPLGQIPVPTPEGGAAQPGPGIADFVRYVYLFGLSFIGIAATLSIFYGGAQYAFSGVPGVKADAKERILNALLGLALALGAYLILNTINPALVSFRPIEESFVKLKTFRFATPLGEGEACETRQDLCRRGLTCGQYEERPDVTGYRCQPSPGTLLGSGQDCTEKPFQCEQNLHCVNQPASGRYVCETGPAQAGTVGPGGACTGQPDCRPGLTCRAAAGATKKCFEF